MSTDTLAHPGNLAEGLNAERRRAAVSIVVGNALEWFDFATYAFLATIIAKNFFPAGDETTALLSTFAAFGIGFVARPIGAIFFGWLGDTRGRKLALLIAMPLMGFGTLLMGLIPPYAAIGVAAPLLLITGRLLQGFSAGGELGNAVAFLVEWAPPRRRALFSSLQQCSTIGGTLLGSGVAAMLTSVLTPEALESWGWRVPFIFGGLVIAPLGWYLRSKVEETPVFEQASAVPLKAPAGAGGDASPWLMGAKTMGLSIVWTVSFYVFLNYLPSFLPKYAGTSPAAALWANTAGLFVMMLAIPAWGLISDRIGRRPLLLAGAIAFLLLPYPLFSLLVSGASPLTAFAAIVASGLLIAIFAGVAPATMSEMFPTHLRTTGMSVGFGLATAIFGGFSPFISTWLISATGSPLAPTFYVMAAAVISTLVILTLRETAHEELK
jgi:MHS family proline/betaine transporter-like MFS transporter